ncbi:hypothetical protein PVAND_006276 [Polypedilum vanderplanki]|uniref:Uncharacterized protein n=1 Tax=Polypedilum vanderplanki TaxID=319348 RepID=A0A9J6C4G1_POLVA|nr:hypothetical protein PVAND_006276 [Polypedilum vanderplanki]
MAACVNVFADGLQILWEEIFEDFKIFNYSPVVNVIHQDFKGVFKRNGFELGLVGYYLINIERIIRTLYFLKAYLQFLKKNVQRLLEKIAIDFKGYFQQPRFGTDQSILEREGHLLIKDALFFVGIHEQYLFEALSLAKYSLEPNALKLIKSTLELIAEVIKYECFWTADYQLTIHNLIRHIQC